MTLVKNINGIFVGPTSSVNTYRGRLNEIVINSQTKQFRLMDGKTAGGQSFAVSAVVDYLSDIGDVLLTDLTSGQALVWNGSNWVNSTITATIADGSITAAKLASNSVIEAKILDGAVTNAKLAGSIALSKLSTTGGTNGQVIRLNGGVATYSDFSFANLSGVALIGSPTAGQVLIYNTTGSTGWKNYTLSGDVTVNSTGVTSIGSEKVTNSMLAGSIALSKLSTSGASTGSVIKFDGTSWAIGSDTNTTSLSGLTTDVLISSPSEAQVLIYDNADNKWKNKILSGEISITKAGVATLAPSNGSIALGKLSQGGASLGQVIAWNGSAWAPATPTSSDRITNGSYSLVVQPQGHVTIPTSSYSTTARMFSQSGVDLYIGTLTSNNYWEFKDSGVLKLPPNGDIVDNNNVSVLGTGGVSFLSDLSDVDLNGHPPQAGEYLVYGGDTWNNVRAGYSLQITELTGETEYFITAGHYYVSNLDNIDPPITPYLTLGVETASVNIGDTLWVYVKKDLGALDFVLKSTSVITLETGFNATSSFFFEGIEYTYSDPTFSTLRLKAGVLYQLTVSSISTTVNSSNLQYILSASNSTQVLGWTSIIGSDPTGGDFPGIGTGDRGFILSGENANAKVALYYDDSTDKVYLKGNTASNGADVYVEAGHSTASNGGKVRLYGGDALNSGHGGYIRLRGGYAYSSSIGGYVELQGGSSQFGAGGYINITAGNADYESSSNGGDLNLQAGAALGSAGNGGSVNITSGSSSHSYGGDITLRTYSGTSYNHTSGNINFIIGDANLGASEGKIKLQGKTELSRGIVSDLNVLHPEDTLVHGTLVYLYVIYGANSFVCGEHFHIYKTNDQGTTRQIVPLTVIAPDKLARVTNSSLYEYTGLPSEAWSNPSNIATAYFVMDTEGGTYDYIFNGNANAFNGEFPFFAACSILSSPTIESPLEYTAIFATGLSDREFLLTPTATNVVFDPALPGELYGANSTFNQVSLLASVDSTTGELFLENLKASVPSIPGNKGVVGANDQGVVSLVDNFKVHIPTVQHRDILRYDATQSKWQATGFIEPVFVGTYIPVADGRTYYHFDIVDPLVVLPSNGVQGDVFYVQLGPNQNRLTFKVPSPIPRLTAFYQGFLVSHPTNMYSGYEVGHPDYWSPSEFYNGNTETISENYMGTDTVVISNFGGLVEFRCYPVNNQGLSETETEYTWHVSVLSGQKPAKYIPSYSDIIDGGPLLGKSCSLSRSEFVSNKLYYYIGNDDVIVDINLPILCPAMEGIELNIKQTGLQDMYINSNMGLIEGEYQFIMSEKGSMATLINDGVNWYLA